MKSFAFAATLLLTGLSTAALAQTVPAPASNAPLDNNTNILAPSNNHAVVRRAVDGSNIANNRDVLSPGTGTHLQPARTPAEKRAHRAAKRARKASKR